jgi:hypothetical protein
MGMLTISENSLQVIFYHYGEKAEDNGINTESRVYLFQNLK